MKESNVPTKLERLERSFNSLLTIRPVFKFKKVEKINSWLKWLLNNNKIDHVYFLGIYLKKKDTFILLKMSRLIECFGLPTEQTTKIWCQLPTQRMNNIRVLPYVRTATY